MVKADPAMFCARRPAPRGARRRLALAALLALAACGGGAEPRYRACESLRDACESVAGPVCAQVDTRVRCVMPPCPSYRLAAFESACAACARSAVDGVFTGRCEAFSRWLEAPGGGGEASRERAGR